MIRYLTHDEIDFTKWDECVEQSVNSMVYAYSWYLNEMAPKWEALVLNDYEAVMPLTQNRKLFIHYLYQPFFIQQLGVFFKRSETGVRVTDFINAIPAHFRFIDINLNEQNLLPEDSPIQLRKRKNFVLNLNHTYHHLHQHFDEHCQRNLKKSHKHHQHVKAIDPALAVAFYQKYKAMNTSDVYPEDYEKFLRVLIAAQQRNLLTCLGVYDSGEAIQAVGVYLKHQSRIIYILGGASDKGRELRSMYALFDTLIREHAEKDMLLDFEGSEIAGIARFFKGFGAHKQWYFKLLINRLPLPLRWLK